MKKKHIEEWITGIIIGLVIDIFIVVKVFAAPVSADEAEMIAKTVAAEAENQSFIGKRLVAAVILNRVESPEFPNTVEGVLSQDGQFSTYKNLSNTQATWEDTLAVQMELESSLNDEVMFFRAGHYGCGKPMFQNGDHYFSSLKK